MNRFVCVGSAYELNLTIAPINDEMCIKGAIVLQSGDDYIRLYTNTNKSTKDDYYNILESIGVQYDIISAHDHDHYTLDEELVKCTLGGKINKQSIQSSDAPTRFYVFGTVTEYGFKLTHIMRTTLNDMLDFELHGAIYDNDKIIDLASNNLLKIVNDIDTQSDPFRCLNLSVRYFDHINRGGDVIDNVCQPTLKCIGAQYIYDYPKEKINDFLILKG